MDTWHKILEVKASMEATMLLNILLFLFFGRDELEVTALQKNGTAMLPCIISLPFCYI